MKKSLILLLFLSLCAGLMAQNKAVDQLFNKYSDLDGFTSVVINKNMFQLFANVDNPNQDEFLKTVKNLDFIKILSTSDPKEMARFSSDLDAAIAGKGYSELMRIKETGSLVRFMTLEKEGVIRELLMISTKSDDCSLIWMAGIIDMKTVSKIADSMHIEGMDQLDKTDR